MFNSSYQDRPIYLFNTLTRKKEVALPKKGQPFRMYTCGPTVHDYAHIGNFRTFAFEDILRRTLKLLGYPLIHVMNITDVDDKTIKKAVEKKLALEDFTSAYTRAFFEDLDALGIERAENYPRATHYIEPMIEMIQALIDKKVAYHGKDKSIYYAISTFKSYGKLSHLKLDELKSNAEGPSDSEEYDKESASDFVLWKAYDSKRDGPVFWDSPFGKGRPGWHMECSCMAMRLLGEELDLHAGGVDNIFPHHENEIAQSEALSGKCFSKLWVHSEHLLVDGKKMSKSLGNFYRLRDLEEKGFSGREVRYQLIASHYRTQVNFTLEGLHAARKSLARIDTIVQRLQQLTNASDPKLQKPQPEIALKEMLDDRFNALIDALTDDLSTPKALAALFDLIRELNAILDKGKMSKACAELSLKLIHTFDQALGLIAPFQNQKNAEVPQEVKALADERTKARKAKNWQEADRCRDELKKLGYTIEDTPDGPKVKKA